MGRLATRPITIPEQVTVAYADGVLTVKGPKGELFRVAPKEIEFLMSTDAHTVIPQIHIPMKNAAPLVGTFYVHIRNMIIGVTKGFAKELEFEGIGYRATLDGRILLLSLGFSHPVRFSIPDGVEISVEKSEIRITGIDKELVGQTAAKIRSFKKPEPYKGKGIHYKGEHIQRKAGKKAGVGSA